MTSSLLNTTSKNPWVPFNLYAVQGESVSQEKISQAIESQDQQVICHACAKKMFFRVKLKGHLNVEHFFPASIETETFSSKAGILHRWKIICLRFRNLFNVFRISPMEGKSRSRNWHVVGGL